MPHLWKAKCSCVSKSKKIGCRVGLLYRMSVGETRLLCESLQKFLCNVAERVWICGVFIHCNFSQTICSGLLQGRWTDWLVRTCNWTFYKSRESTWKTNVSEEIEYFFFSFNFPLDICFHFILSLIYYPYPFYSSSFGYCQLEY